MTIRPPGTRHAHHLPGDVERLGREHGAEDTDDQVERAIRDRLQVRRVALLEAAVRQAQLRGSPVARLHQVARDIDAEDIRPRLRRRHGRGAVAAAQVEHFEPFADTDGPHQRFPAFAHGRRNAGEVALLPQRLVRVDRCAGFFRYIRLLQHESHPFARCVVDRQR
jgi:hypothetical protein